MINSSIEAQKAKIKDPQISKLFEMINETTEEAFNLLENLLRWTRNQNGKTKIYATLFNLTPVARQVVSLFSAIANAKEIELINRIEGKFDIFADEDMIKTVLRNLISNAIKFTYTGGQVELSLADSGDYWTIYVKDNGKGIPKDLPPDAAVLEVPAVLDAAVLVEFPEPPHAARPAAAAMAAVHFIKLRREIIFFAIIKPSCFWQSAQAFFIFRLFLLIQPCSVVVQRPLKSGVRFSRKAEMPSRESAVVKQ